MDGEQKENLATRLASGRVRLRDLPGPELLKAVEVLREVVESGRPAGDSVESAWADDKDLHTLSDEELSEQIDLLQEQIELEKRRNDLDRKAIKLGLLKLADQAPRCSYLKANGKPCRAPAMGNRLFCVFHVRAFDTTDSPRINVSVLEDRQSLQLTVKQIMEQIIAGRIEPQTASLLLRAVQIANSTLKPKRIRVASPKRKQAQSDTGEDWGNPEESSA